MLNVLWATDVEQVPGCLVNLIKKYLDSSDTVLCEDILLAAAELGSFLLKYNYLLIRGYSFRSMGYLEM